MKATVLISLLVVAFWGSAFSQCWEDLPLIRKDTTLAAGIYVIEPRPGYKAKVTFEAIPEIIREDFTTVGAWTNATSTGDPYLNRTVSYSNTKDAYVFLNFVGTKIELVTATAPHHGSAIVQVNQDPPVTISLKSTERQEMVTVFSKVVPVGHNTIRVRVVGDGYVVIDYFKIQ